MPLSEAPTRKGRRIGWPVRGLLILVALWLAYKWADHVSPATMAAISEQVRGGKLAAGDNKEVALPRGYRHKAVRGVVDVMVQPDGKIAFLLKTSEGGKGSFDGMLFVDAGYPMLMELDYYGRETPNIFESRRDSMVVREKISENVY